MPTNIPNALNTVIVEQRRLAILRLLNGILNGVTNEEVLSNLLSVLAFKCGRENLREHLSELERLGVVKLDKVEKLVLIELTRKGAEVAEGITLVDGISRPAPEFPY